MQIKKSIEYTSYVVILLILPHLMADRYSQHILNMILIYCILTMSLNLVFGYCGLLSLGHAGLYGIGAYVSALVSTKLGVPFFLSFCLAGLGGVVIGVVIGFPTLKLAGPYFAMATIGFNRIVEMIFLNWVSVTGGPAGITGIPSPKFLGVQLDTEGSYYYLVATVLLTLFILYRNLITSHFGKTIIAMRDNVIAAQAMGINTSLLRVSIFAISSIYAALAGSLYVHMVKYVAPDAFPVLESIALLIMVVLGGPGFIKGPIYGAIIVVLANEYLQYLESFNMLIYGATLMVLLVFLPSGVAGMIERLKYYFWGQKRMKDYLPEVGIEEM